jgi:hypothetical protein
MGEMVLPLLLTAAPLEGVERRRAEASFTVPAPVAVVFPLFDPINEARWAEGWRMTPVQPVPFRVERNAVFLTESQGGPAIWTIVRFEPEAHVIEYLVLVPGLMQRWITVRCAAEGDATRVSVTYELTALGPEGNQALSRYDAAFIDAWREPVTRAAREATRGRQD